MQDILKFKVIHELKSVYRVCSVDERKESSAEHSWAALLLADYFIERMQLDVDRLKVYELLMYHDLVEIETGDTPLAPGVDRSKKKELEAVGKKTLKEKLPQIMQEKYKMLADEYDENQTKEAQFAHAVDQLEAFIHELDYKEDWKGWSKDYLLSKKLHYMEAFPEMKKIFLELADFVESKGFFDQ